MGFRYGLPYKGSKNAIASWIIQNLPKADTFVDLFFGGGAVTHVALLSGKYQHFIVNDIDGRLPKLFLDCIYGKYTIANHPEWVSREEFMQRKDDDAYIALIWSFANNGIDYIYGKEIEEFKHQYHIAVFEDKPELLRPYGYNISSSHLNRPYDRYLEFNKHIKKTARSDLDSIVRQIEIERLQSLQSLQSDYMDAIAKVKTNLHDYVIYCDPPYEGTNCGKYRGFDSKRFHEWALEQDNIYISEYQMPDGFIPIAQKEKPVLSSARSNSLKATEKIYTNQRTYDKFSDEQKRAIEMNFSEQMTIFQFIEEHDGQ